MVIRIQASVVLECLYGMLVTFFVTLNSCIGKDLRKPSLSMHLFFDVCHKRQQSYSEL